MYLSWCFGLLVHVWLALNSRRLTWPLLEIKLTVRVKCENWLLFWIGLNGVLESLNKWTGTDIFQLSPFQIICKHPLVKHRNAVMKLMKTGYYLQYKLSERLEKKNTSKDYSIVFNNACFLYSRLKCLFARRQSWCLHEWVTKGKMNLLNSKSAVYNVVLVTFRWKWHAI